MASMPIREQHRKSNLYVIPLQCFAKNYLINLTVVIKEGNDKKKKKTIDKEKRKGKKNKKTKKHQRQKNVLKYLPN